MKTNNLVAKHAHRYNRAAVHTDRKKAAKSGYTKHKNAKTNVRDVSKRF